MKSTWWIALCLCGIAGLASSQTSEELLNRSRTTDNVLTHSMGYDRKSYSSLKEINKSNVNRLVPVWNSSVMNESGELAAPGALHTSVRSPGLGCCPASAVAERPTVLDTPPAVAAKRATDLWNGAGAPHRR